MTTSALGTAPPAPQERCPRPPSIWEHGASLTCWLSLPPQQPKKPSPIDAAHFDGKEECPEDATIPRDNSSPGDTPPCPSRAPTMSARDVEVQSIANMTLSPTPNNQQKNLFLSMLRVFLLTQTTH